MSLVQDTHCQGMSLVQDTHCQAMSLVQDTHCQAMSLNSFLTGIRESLGLPGG